MKRVVKGFAAGAALGAVIAILLAPRTGAQSQKLLKAKAHAIKGMVAAKAAAAKKLSEKVYKKLVDEAMELAKQQKMTAKQVQALKKDLLVRYKDLKKELG